MPALSILTENWRNLDMLVQTEGGGQMSEFIINSEQLERMIEAIEHDTSRKINRLIIDGVRQTEIVRCRDCTGLVETDNPISSTGWWCVQNDTPRSPDGFCDWAERKEVCE